MDVKFSDDFLKSLKRLNRHGTWWYKTYEFFRYKIPCFLKNIWYFRKELWRHRGYDYTFTLMIMRSSLEKICSYLEFYGHEVDEPRLKKVHKIKTFK